MGSIRPGTGYLNFLHDKIRTVTARSRWLPAGWDRGVGRFGRGSIGSSGGLGSCCWRRNERISYVTRRSPGPGGWRCGARALRARAHSRGLSGSLFALVRQRVFVLPEAGDNSAASGGHIRTEFARVIRTTGSENLGGRLRVRQAKLRSRYRADRQRSRQASDP